MSEGFDSTRCPMLGSHDACPVPRVAVYGFIAALAVMLALSACGGSSGDESTKINGSIHVPAGKSPGAVATVNGSIDVDDNAAVTSATTINGSVHLGDQATATSLSSVNGSLGWSANAACLSTESELTPMTSAPASLKTS